VIDALRRGLDPWQAERLALQLRPTLDRMRSNRREIIREDSVLHQELAPDGAAVRGHFRSRAREKFWLPLCYSQSCIGVIPPLCEWGSPSRKAH
jgi:hypothetical protein